MNGATFQWLPDGERLHLQHGPSDLIIWAEGARDEAYKAAAKRFETVIEEIVSELTDLRKKLTPTTRNPKGSVAKRMHAACLPFTQTNYVTRMAAVAGAVADEVLTAMIDAADLTRAYVNNGGDIALHLSPGEVFSTAMIGHSGADLGKIKIASTDAVRGIATSGRHGRSLSLGIADSVTALAKNAAAADVAATLIANAVDIPGHRGISRRAACEVEDESDLGRLQVVVGCEPLSDSDCKVALARGRSYAEEVGSKGLTAGAGLFLQGHAVTTNSQFIGKDDHL